ncbi:MAG: GAF domain-containing protein, partial [Chloroflexi bacterium]|nr:GAF domain-containing protein [Chloroflexota bacterium]
MVLAQQRPGPSARPVAGPRRAIKPAARVDAAVPTQADALGRIAAKVSGRSDLAGLFDDIIGETFSLFGVDRAGLWLYDPAAAAPLKLATQRGLSPVIVAAIESLPWDAPTTGMEALRTARVRVLDRAMRSTTPELRAVYRSIGVRTVCFVPLIFGDEPLGLLVLYHRESHAWTTEQRALARAFGDQMATAIGSARLAESSRTLAQRLAWIAGLTGRLSRLNDRDSIAWAIVAEAKQLTQHDTIRVYRVDHATAMCEPIAFEGTFLGSSSPDLQTLRVAVGQGLTGWVAEHGTPLRIGDVNLDPRVVIVGSDRPESMLVVPMIHDETIQGVIVVSALGVDRFDADDELTLTIFAASAVQALINAENLERL